MRDLLTSSQAGTLEGSYIHKSEAYGVWYVCVCVCVCVCV